MSTSSCIDLRQTSAVIEWQSDDTTHSLTTPDPSNTSIKLSIRLDSENHALFEILVPIKLKDIPGSTAIYLRICPSSITSFEFSSSTTPPEDVKQKLNSVVTRLDLELNKGPTVLVSPDVGERVVPARPRSGKVLDAIYQLSRVSALNVYIEDAKLSKDQLQSISDGVNHKLLQPFPNSDQDISRMFGGRGAKAINLPDPSPPSYTEAASLPPPPTDVPAPNRKRARPNSQEPCDDIAKVWAAVQTINKRDAMWTTAFEALQRENKELKEDNAKLRTEVATLSKSQQDLEEEVAELKQNLRDIEDTKDVEKIEIQDDIIALANRVDYLDRGKDDAAFLDKVSKEVLHQISSRLSGD